MSCKLGLLWRTVRHLKYIQIFGRIYYNLYTPKINTVPLQISPLFQGLSVSPARRTSSMPNEFEWLLLNEFGALSEIGWQDASRSKLWRYNQHYFDDLNAFGASERSTHHQLLIDRWSEDNPIGIGHGWEPYPTSLRIVNWIKWSSGENALSHEAIANLSLQAKWLSKRLEWHLLGNHLFANAKALVFAGLFFEGNEADVWLKHGLKILKQQVPDQILSDGGQFELSTMYHALALEDLLDLVNIAEANLSRLPSEANQQVLEWRSIIPEMINWLSSMSHPDNSIAFFNDSAFGVAASNIELFQYASRLGFDIKKPRVGVTDLNHTGYIRLQSHKAVLIADIAPIGPDHLPGHAHADTLSFELSVHGQRVFVNSGTSVYGVSEKRLMQRGTLAHNTVAIKRQDSSEVWSGFRVGSRAKILSRLTGYDKGIMFASGAHDGYARKHEGLIHWREFSLGDQKLRIRDEISKQEAAEARFHMHPHVFVRKLGRSHGEIVCKDGLILNWSCFGASHVQIIQSCWHPEFGLDINNQCIVAHFDQKVFEFNVDWV